MTQRSKARRLSESGFTLIELLVVIVIIGILAAIAIPTFLSQREKGWRAQAVNDLKNAATAIESYATETGGNYLDLNLVTEDDDVLQGEGYRGGALVDLVVSADTSTYCISGVHERLARSFVYRSDTGVVAEGAAGFLSC